MSARGKKPKVVKAWALKHQRAYVDFLPYSAIEPEFRFTDDEGCSWRRAGRVVLVEIREIPRKRKRTVARAADAASRVWWADVDRAAKSARVLRDKTKRKRKRT